MLEVKDIVVRYGRREVIHGLSLNVAAGEAVTLIGSNGAGKTTTLKTISGMLRPVEGSITFDGECIDKMDPHDIIAHGLVQVPEGRLLFPDMTVYEHLELGAVRARSGGRLLALSGTGLPEPGAVRGHASAHGVFGGCRPRRRAADAR